MRNRMIKAKNPSAWNGNPATELKFVLDVNRETKGFTLLSEWNCIRLNIPCTADIQNIVTPACRRLYNNGRNFLLILASGPILNMICSNKTASVEVERMRTVSNV
jgi:hypothetical protein